MRGVCAVLLLGASAYLIDGQQTAGIVLGLSTMGWACVVMITKLDRIAG